MGDFGRCASATHLQCEGKIAPGQGICDKGGIVITAACIESPLVIDTPARCTMGQFAFSLESYKPISS